MNTAKRINVLLNSSGVPVWQRNYYERIVRDDPAYKAILYYIHTNPSNWDTDEENR
jgi:putative transposase